MQISRRALMVGGVGVGLVVAWSLWPEGDVAGLPVADGETAFGGWIKIGADGHIVVAVPQCEHGQGVYTALPQIVADEMGADWRTVGVEAAPVAVLYANPLAAEAVFGAGDAIARALPGHAPMLTGGSSSVRMFEGPLRRAAAGTRALLCKAAVARWGGDWQACRTEGGFVILAQNRARFGELAAAAARESLPATPTLRIGDVGRLTGTPAPRLDAPAKVDGSVNFAGDIRLPGMVFASLRQGPAGGNRLVGLDRKAAEAVSGMVALVENPGWIAAIGTTWWAANRALAVLDPRFESAAPPVTTASIDRALADALAASGARVAGSGDIAATVTGAGVVRAEYRVAPGVHAAIEPVTATASFEDGKLILWVATQAPGLARAAAARAAGVPESAVVLHPLMAGGSFGANLEVRVAEQAALLTTQLKRPVQLTWSRSESLIQTPVRPPAIARMTAKTAGGVIQGWHAAIVTPALGAELRTRLTGSGPWLKGDSDAVAVDGAAPPYRLANWAVDHHAADIGSLSGWWRSGAHAATCFFTECFLDELAHAAGAEPVSYRIAMLGGAPRLARCLSTVAALGGWQGGVAGSGQGIAAHAMRGSYIALMVEGGMGDGAVPRIDRMVAAVDVGRTINPDLVRQAIEGGLIFGMAAAIGAATGFANGIPDVRGFRDLGLPRLSTTPDITVEIIESKADPGGASELGVPVVAPALANAIFASSGRRLRTLPL
ncbi:molybdopterin-dependent oxidoreductase [Sphingomonas donggukensis]|uniref:Molybdopterin-dependent oxidoreductase n=1 Tax=Sphingomonas donggukensis TaxID=2949093 RepID=A0ABY4TSG8_9SPHN|nr:molybdopterin cofactor-binding domain-containing protein [Sphingomonas donggukensis]URW75341.1 molybdopterin-dependent oxidoreductase [Sphingomonas donggukensis]